MRTDLLKIFRAAAEFLVLAVLAVLVTGVVAIDLLVFGAVREISATEMTQESLLLICTAIFCFAAWKRPDARGFLVLVAGFIACMLLRELDYLWDKIWHGFWVWPTLAVAFSSIGAAIFVWRDTVIRPMALFVDTKPSFYIFTGLVIVLVFSRVFGSGNLLWRHVLPKEHVTLFRGPLQEGLELFGYVFLTWGSILMLRFRNLPQDTTES